MKNPNKAYEDAAYTLRKCVEENGEVATLIAMRNAFSDHRKEGTDTLLYDMYQALINIKLREFRTENGFGYESPMHHEKVKESN